MSAVARQAASIDWDRIQRIALLVAACGLSLFGLVSMSLYWLDSLTSPHQIYLSYLVAYIFWLGIALGCLAILMLHHLTGGVWGIVLRRVLESASRTLVLIAVLFVPLLFGVRSLYPWAQPELATADEHLDHQQMYLNVPFFIGRSVAYFAIWLIITYFLNKWSAQQDRNEGPREQQHFQQLSAPGLILYGGTITFAAIDWVMSLEPHWYSTIYPVLFATSQLLTGLAFAITVVILLSSWPPLSEVIGPTHLRDLGSLLLTFVLFWAYMSFSQFMLIWAGNLPEEIPWYLRRTRDGWEWVAIVLILLHFALPFLLLLSRDVKEKGPRLAAVAVGVLVMRFIDVFWWIEPAASQDGFPFFWLLDLTALAGLGGIWVWWFVWQLKQRSLLPTRDPYYQEVLHHEQST